ncbi:MAG TPA: MFS transporter [Methanoregulaceae archaeon]|nr:MFS transporter [Methanoregulaceae archaeon]HPX72654.1 MFS transporter [Methanoregulaceae archaeon]HQA80387.1 MFS transporter [Methanoregulaceae archaeon]
MDRPNPSPEATGEVPAICRTPAPPLSSTDKGIVLFIAALAGFLTPFDGSAVNIALPVMAAEFHLDAIMLSWITTAYLLTSAVFLVPFGRIADIYGRKRVFLYGIALFTGASFVMTMVSTAEMLIAIRLIQGFGGAMIFGTALAILSSVFSPGERGRALGIYIMAVYLGLTMGPFLGGILTGYLGWRSIFLVNVPLGILACLLILWRLHGEWAECQGERFDLRGSVLYACSLVAVMLGLSTVPDLKGVLLLSVGMVFGVIFVLYELRVPLPVLDLSLFTKNRVFAFSNLAALISYCATYAVTFLLSLDLQLTRGFSPEQAGGILIVLPAVQALLSPVAGRLSDRIDSQVLASIGIALTAVGMFPLVFISESTPVLYLIACLVVLGAGFGIFSSPNINAIMSSVEKRYLGVASGMNGTVRLVGQMLSMGIVMMLFSLFIGPVMITPEYFPEFLQSLHYAFLIFSLLSLVGVVASLMRGKGLPGGRGGSDGK